MEFAERKEGEEYEHGKIIARDVSALAYAGMP